MPTTAAPVRCHPKGAVVAAAVDSPVVLALDVTDPGVEDVDARVVAGLVPDRGVLIVAVLTPPARASLNARLLAWRQAQRIDRADTLAARLRATAAMGGRGITVSAVSRILSGSAPTAQCRNP